MMNNGAKPRQIEYVIEYIRGVVRIGHSLGHKCCNTDRNVSLLPFQFWCLWVPVQELTENRNIEGREEEGCVISSLDASYWLFKRGVTTIYDRGCMNVEWRISDKKMRHY